METTTNGRMDTKGKAENFNRSSALIGADETQSRREAKTRRGKGAHAKKRRRKGRKSGKGGNLTRSVIEMHRSWMPRESMGQYRNQNGCIRRYKYCENPGDNHNRSTHG